MVALKSHIRLLDWDLGLIPSTFMDRIRLSKRCFWFYKLHVYLAKLAVMGSSEKNHLYKYPDIIIWIHISKVIMKS